MTILRAALVFCAGVCAVQAPQAEPVTWPPVWCTEDEIATASPAPQLSNSSSLARVPFVTGMVSAGYLVSLDETNRPTIHCVSPESDPGLAYWGSEAVAGLVFSTPRRPNEAVPGGRYLVRLYDFFGIGTVRQPPPAPILPSCTKDPVASAATTAPKPVERVQPVYPEGAEIEGMEGSATVVVDVYANGGTTPRCLQSSGPPGWFEYAAMTALRQWRFAASETPGERIYVVTVKFKLED